MRLTRLSCRALAGPGLLLLLAPACATPPAAVDPPSPRPPERLVWPHADQVCTTDRTPIWLRTPAEVLDTAGLRDSLERIIPVRPEGAEEPFVDVAINMYQGDAGTSVHRSHANIEGAAVDAAVERLGAALSPPRILLEPLRFRIHIVRNPVLRLSVLRPERCAPHIAHEDDEWPDLGPGVTATEGRGWPTQSPSTIGVRVGVSAVGEVGEVEFLTGNRALLPRVQAIVSGLALDPALLGNEPVADDLFLVFRIAGGSLAALPSAPGPPPVRGDRRRRFGTGR